MVLLPWLRKVQVRFARNGNTQDRFPLDAHDFRREAARERVRADRSNTQFAILVIELPADRRQHRDFAFLCNVLSQRLRITDTAGQLPDGRVAVLFPDTQKDGAWKVASDICDHYPLGHARPTAKSSFIQTKVHRLTTTHILAPSDPSRVTLTRWNRCSRTLHQY